MKIVRILCVVSLTWIFASLSFAYGPASAPAMQSPGQTKVVNAASGPIKQVKAAPAVVNENEMETLVAAMQEYLEADRSRSSVERTMREIRRELARLEERGVLKPEFSPKKLTNEELGEKIRELAKTKEVAGPVDWKMRVHVGLVCMSFLTTGQCGRLPEIRTRSIRPPAIELKAGSQ